MKKFKDHIDENSGYKGHIEKCASENFGKHTGMDWIYKNWELPIKDKGEAGYYIATWYDTILNSKGKKDQKNVEKSVDNILDFYKKLIQLNPELGKIEIPSLMQLYDVCLGAISKFNLEDITFYTNMDWDDRLKYNRDHRSDINMIEKKAGISCFWVLSPKTRERVELEL